LGTSTLEEVKKGDRQYLKQLYEKYRKEFGQWAAKHYGVDDDTTAEIYQKTFIAFYYNIKEGKLTQMNSSEKTYLFAIGKNLLREYFRASEKVAEPLELHVNLEDVDCTIFEKYELEDKQKAVRQMLSTIGEPCRTVLEMFYFHDHNLKTIAAAMNYKTEQIAAKRKFICLKQLRSLVSETLN